MYSCLFTFTYIYIYIYIYTFMYTPKPTHTHTHTHRTTNLYRTYIVAVLTWLALDHTFNVIHVSPFPVSGTHAHTNAS